MSREEEGEEEGEGGGEGEGKGEEGGEEAAQLNARHTVGHLLLVEGRPLDLVSCSPFFFSPSFLSLHSSPSFPHPVLLVAGWSGDSSGSSTVNQAMDFVRALSQRLAVTERERSEEVQAFNKKLCAWFSPRAHTVLACHHNIVCACAALPQIGGGAILL